LGTASRHPRSFFIHHVKLRQEESSGDALARAHDLRYAEVRAVFGLYRVAVRLVAEDARQGVRGIVPLVVPIEDVGRSSATP
jgi:hypothetical protein